MSNQDNAAKIVVDVATADGPNAANNDNDDDSANTNDAGEVDATTAITAAATTTTTTTTSEGGGGGGVQDEGQKTTGLTVVSSTTFASNNVPTTGGFDMGWTQLGVGADDVLPLRYPHDVTEWSVDDTEIYVVGTAGQKITALGDDFTIKSKLTNPKLERLILRSHLIKSMDNLADLTHLQLLELYDNMVQTLDEDSLKGCGPSLQTLDMSFNAIRDMTPVQFCTGNLTQLYIANNKIKTMSGLKNLIHLTKIDLGANRIRVIDGDELSGLVNLEELWIGKNKIETITGLEKLTKLRRLDIQSNRLTRIENLQGQCDTLEELYLAHNGIDDVGAYLETGLKLNFPNLTVLDLSRNRLTTTVPFGHLSAIEELWISGNEMESFDAVVPLRDASQNGSIPNLETLYLEYNPLASDYEYRKKLAEWIPSLKQIDATMIGGLAAHGVVPAGVHSTTTTPATSAASGLPTAERLRQLQAAAIERAKRETEAAAAAAACATNKETATE